MLQYATWDSVSDIVCPSFTNSLNCLLFVDSYTKLNKPKQQVKEGDIITMCSATFGDQMWSTRGVGLNRVMAAIRLRSGATVKLVLETPGQYKKKRDITAKQLKDREEAAAAAQAKKDSLLKELEQDEQKLNPKKFFGLF